jgi:hypothetical protein
MAEICSSETPVSFHRTYTACYRRRQKVHTYTTGCPLQHQQKDCYTLSACGLRLGRNRRVPWVATNPDLQGLGSRRSNGLRQQTWRRLNPVGHEDPGFQTVALRDPTLQQTLHVKLRSMFQSKNESRLSKDNRHLLLLCLYLPLFSLCSNRSLKIIWFYVRYEVSTAVTMKNDVFWDIETQFVLHRRHITSSLQSSVS